MVRRADDGRVVLFDERCHDRVFRVHAGHHVHHWRVSGCGLEEGVDEVTYLRCLSVCALVLGLATVCRSQSTALTVHPDNGYDQVAGQSSLVPGTQRTNLYLLNEPWAYHIAGASSGSTSYASYAFQASIQWKSQTGGWVNLGNYGTSIPLGGSVTGCPEHSDTSYVSGGGDWAVQNWLSTIKGLPGEYRLTGRFTPSGVANGGSAPPESHVIFNYYPPGTGTITIEVYDGPGVITTGCAGKQVTYGGQVQGDLQRVFYVPSDGVYRVVLGRCLGVPTPCSLEFGNPANNRTVQVSAQEGKNVIYRIYPVGILPDRFLRLRLRLQVTWLSR